MKVNYLGYIADKNLGTIGRGLSISFKWGKEQKPVGSMLVGTSPEFELALYTTCILARLAWLSFISDLRTVLTLQAGPEVPSEAERPDCRHHHPPLHQARRGGVCGQRIPGVQIIIVEPHQQIKIDLTTFNSSLLLRNV